MINRQQMQITAQVTLAGTKVSVYADTQAKYEEFVKGVGDLGGDVTLLTRMTPIQQEFTLTFNEYGDIS